VLFCGIKTFRQSCAPAKATLTFSDGEIREVEIRGFGTELVRRSTAGASESFAGQAQAVQITASGSNVIPAGAVSSHDGTFTTSIRFYDTINVVQPNLYATRFRLKGVKPRILLRNTSLETITAIPRFLPVPGDPSNFIDLPSLTLRPLEIADLDLQPLKSAAEGNPEYDQLAVQIINSGKPGSLVRALNGSDEATGMTMTYLCAILARFASQRGPVHGDWIMTSPPLFR